MSQMQKRLIIIVFVVAVLSFAGVFVWIMMRDGDNDGTQKNTPVQQAQEEPVATATPEPTPTQDPHAGMVRSEMTGQWIKKKNKNNRYVAVMINNIEYAFRNQKGTSKAGVIYEALAEGGITRMLALFDNIKDVKQIGSVRSARHYYAQFAYEWDAIFCHFGHTKYAVSKMEQLGTDNLSGLSGIGPVVYARTSALRAPHNVYTNGKKILKGAKKLGYKTKTKKRDMAEHFAFYEEDTNLKKGKKAKQITLPFSYYSTAKLKYNKKKKVYLKYEYGQKHMDTHYKKQLAFKNVIVQFVQESNIDRNGYQTMNLGNTTGKGYYLTNGKRIAITWKRNEKKNIMVYKTTDGKTLTVNPGKTYIAVFPKNRKNLVSIK